MERFIFQLKRSKVDGFSPGELIGRLEQFVSESERIIPQAGAALDEHRLGTLGELVDESQAGAAAALGNQVPETIELAASARRLGAVAATSFGAGFGGSVWALVRSDGADALIEEWAGRYAARFADAARHARFFRSKAGAAAERVM
jgi:galactokinase